MIESCIVMYNIYSAYPPLNGTSVTWEGQPLFTQGGQPIVYTVEEVNANGSPWTHHHYTSHPDGLVVTNTYASPLTSVHAQKVWSGGLAADHTQPKMNLYRNGRLFTDAVPHITPDTQADGVFHYLWDNLPLTDAFGQTYFYYVDEETVPLGYGKMVTGSGTADDPYVITNTFGAQLSDIAAQKDWVNGPQPYPPITLELQRQMPGESGFDPVDSVTLPSGNHLHIWRQQPIADDQGAEILYRVLETQVGDQPVVNNQAGRHAVGITGSWRQGFSITNRYVPDLTQVLVKKAYVNGDPACHLPIQVQLFRQPDGGNREYVGSQVELNALNG